VVTHLTTNPSVRCLNRAERTGSFVFNVLWPYVEDVVFFSNQTVSRICARARLSLIISTIFRSLMFSLLSMATSADMFAPFASSYKPQPSLLESRSGVSWRQAIGHQRHVEPVVERGLYIQVDSSIRSTALALISFVLYTSS
jgi:hypothetical protein